MEGHKSKNGDLYSEIFLSLGLKKSRKCTTEFPRVLSLISSILEATIEKNEKLLDSMTTEDTFTVFHGLRAPSLSINRYMKRIFKYSMCSPSCFILAQIYIDKFLQQPNVHLTSLNVHRLLITSVVVAAKFIDDAFYNNAYYARVGGISTTEMNRLEINFLFRLDFRLQVDYNTFGNYCLQLENEANNCRVERLIKVCGLIDLVETEESKCQKTVQIYSCEAV